MKIGSFHLDRLEFSGALGDLGTLIPLAVALIAVCGMGFTPVFLLVGLFYIATGAFYRLPVPVQPMKSITAVALASPAMATLPVLSASGLMLGAILLVMALSGLMDQIARLFSKPVVRGIQLGVGLLLFMKGVDLIARPEIFLRAGSPTPSFAGVAINPLLGAAAVFAALALLGSRRFPVALVLVAGGVAVGAAFGAFDGARLQTGPTPLSVSLPGLSDLWPALVLLVLPQLPLTIGNAIFGTSDAARSFYGEKARRVTNRSLTIGMGVANLAAGALSAMPMCHGAGGLAAHHRFGARSGGAPIMIGTVFLLLALMLGNVGTVLLGSIPAAVLGTLLAFAGVELALLVRDVSEKNDLFVTLVIAGVGLATNMGIALGAGLGVSLLLRAFRVRL